MKATSIVKAKGLFLLSTVIIFSLALALSAHAGNMTLRTTTWQQDTLINISFDGGAWTGNGTTHVGIYASCSNTANSSVSRVFNVSNSTLTDDSNNFNFGDVNVTIDSGIVLEDSSSCTVTATSTGVGDADGQVLSGTTTVVDRTAPTVPTSLSPTNTQTNNTLDITATVTGADTTACTLTFIGSSPKGASRTNSMTHSGNQCSSTFTSVSDLTYQYQITATDGTNTSSATASAYITVNAEQSNKAGLAVLKDVEIAKQKQSTGNILFIIAAIVVVMAILNKND